MLSEVLRAALTASACAALLYNLFLDGALSPSSSPSSPSHSSSLFSSSSSVPSVQASLPASAPRYTLHLVLPPSFATWPAPASRAWLAALRAQDLPARETALWVVAWTRLPPHAKQWMEDAASRYGRVLFHTAPPHLGVAAVVAAGLARSLAAGASHHIVVRLWRNTYCVCLRVRCGSHSVPSILPLP